MSVNGLSQSLNDARRIGWLKFRLVTRMCVCMCVLECYAHIWTKDGAKANITLNEELITDSPVKKPEQQSSEHQSFTH